MGDERLAKLEQALALCLEIDQSFGELHSWLENVENEIENCPPVTTGHQRDQLMQQQVHNTVKFSCPVETAHILGYLIKSHISYLKYFYLKLLI